MVDTLSIERVVSCKYPSGMSQQLRNGEREGPKNQPPSTRFVLWIHKIACGCCQVSDIQGHLGFTSLFRYKSGEPILRCAKVSSGAGERARERGAGKTCCWIVNSQDDKVMLVIVRETAEPFEQTVSSIVHLLIRNGSFCEPSDGAWHCIVMEILMQLQEQVSWPGQKCTSSIGWPAPFLQLGGHALPHWIMNANLCDGSTYP